MRKDAILAFAGMVIVEGMGVGGNTLYKSATAHGMNSYVFTFYVFLAAFFFTLPFPFMAPRSTPINFSIVFQIFLLSLLMYLSQICGLIGIKYSSPTLSSIMGNLSPSFTFALAFLFRMEIINLRSYASQAKIIGTIFSISGALIATLYSGPLLLSDSVSMNWIIGGILLFGQYLLISLVLVGQGKLLVKYPVSMMVLFVFSLSLLLVAGLAGLVMARDVDAWKLKPDVVLVVILYMGFSATFLSGVVQLWILRLKGPVYVAMFKPLTIVMAVIMGMLFLGDSLYLGSVVGGMIITIGFYGVLWGKAKEEIGSSIEIVAPLL